VPHRATPADKAKANPHKPKTRSKLMQVLKPNSTGAFVMQWQQFLRGQGYLLDATASFDDGTEKATRAFQNE